MSAPPALTVINLGGASSHWSWRSCQAGDASDRMPHCVGEDDARWEPPGGLRPHRRAQDAAALPPLHVVHNVRSLCEDVKALANRSDSRNCAGIPVRLKGSVGQGDGADKRKGPRRGGGRTVVRLNTAALGERVTTPNRSRNRLAKEIGVSPGCMATPVNGRRTPSSRIRRRMRKVLGADDFDDLFRLEDGHGQP